MNNFVFQNPTRLIFGRGSIARLGQEIDSNKRILLLFGGGSARKNGVYDQVKEALKNHFFMEFWGIEPNPDYDTAMKAVRLARENGIDYLVAVGGGSVIDATKFIAHAIPYEGEPWDLVADTSLVKKTTPLATVLTTPATGSEMNHRGVLSRRSTQEKVSFVTPWSFPRFSILDPDVCKTLPVRQIANGVVDAFVHVMEQYLTYPNHDLLMDRWAEGVLQTLVEIGPRVTGPEPDPEAIDNFMLSATMALNGFVSIGTPQDWATHRIGYELTILYGLAHAETLAVLYPALLKVLKEQKKEKLVQYADRVWNITDGTPDEIAEKAIAQTEKFFREMGLPVRMQDYGVPEEAVDLMYSRLKERGAVYGEHNNVTPEVAREIFIRSRE